MPKGKYEVRASFPGRGCTLFCDVDMEYGDEAVALARARQIVKEEFGAFVVAAADWSIKKVESTEGGKTNG